MSRTCTECKYSHDYRMGSKEVTLCGAPDLVRDPVTGEVVVGARYARNDDRLCAPEGTWFVRASQPQPLRWFPRLWARREPSILDCMPGSTP